MPPHAGAYSYNVSVVGGNWCIASFNVTACPPATLTCAPARVVAMTPATSAQCSNVAMPVSSFYNVTAPGDILPVVTVSPWMPIALKFGPGEPGLSACRTGPLQYGAKGWLRSGRAAHGAFMCNLAHQVSPLNPFLGGAPSAAPAAREALAARGSRSCLMPTSRLPCTAEAPLASPPRAGVYSYNVSVQGGSWCTTTLTVAACPGVTLTCPAPRVVALPHGGSCASVTLPYSDIYTVASPSGSLWAVMLNPPLPQYMNFTPGELGFAHDWGGLGKAAGMGGCAGGGPALVGAALQTSQPPDCYQSALPPTPAPASRRLQVQHIPDGRQLVHHVVQRDGVPSPHGDVRHGRGAGAAAERPLRRICRGPAVHLQRHSAPGDHPCGDGGPAAAVQPELRAW